MEENHTSENENEMYSANRRRFMKYVGATGASLTIGAAGFSGTSQAETVKPEPKIHSETQTRTLGDHVYYDERYLDCGSSLERIDSGFLAGNWYYVFRTESCCSAVDYKTDTGESIAAGVITGNEGYKIEELDAPDQVSTSIDGNSDWGIGVHAPDKKSYSWDDATVDTLKELITYFSDIGGAYSSASDIVDYWKHATQSTDDDSAIVEDNWDLWGPYATDSKTDKLSHYLKFQHVFPPSDSNKWDKDYVDSWVTNNLNHNLVDLNNYSHTWGISIPVLPTPDDASTSEMNKYGIEKVPASEVDDAITTNTSLDLNDSICS